MGGLTGCLGHEYYILDGIDTIENRTVAVKLISHNDNELAHDFFLSVVQAAQTLPALGTDRNNISGWANPVPISCAT
jgi:hypothetical protein